MLFNIIKFFFFITLSVSTCFSQAWKAEVKTALKNGSAIVVDEAGRVVFEHRIREKFIPASSIKIATVASAISILGPNHRFKTEFYLLPGNILGVKGYGDPNLVSEELKLVASALIKTIRNDRGLNGIGSGIEGILLDDSYFQNLINIDGASNTNNPYDAMPGALVANFNTVNVKKLKNGKVISAEKQTPITPIAIKLARKLKIGTQRINLGKDRELRLRYFAELLSEFLKAKGLRVKPKIDLAKIDSDSSYLIYKHFTKKDVTAVSKDLLKYSTNFLANQLFLHIGIKQYGIPGNINKSRRTINDFLKMRLNWNSEVFEGSGLSRKTKVSAIEMNELLDYFFPYKNLLPEVANRIYAKTGTLSSVSSLTGYMEKKDNKLYRFVILINSSVPRDRRLSIAKKIYRNIN